jgi:hypothetical protein
MRQLSGPTSWSDPYVLLKALPPDLTGEDISVAV